MPTGQRRLFEADVIGAAELQRRESRIQDFPGRNAAAADQLQLLGVSAAAIERLGKMGEINSVTPVVATMNGVVVERKLARARWCSRPTACSWWPICRRLWAVAQVPEQQVSLVRPAGGEHRSAGAGQRKDDRQADLVGPDHRPRDAYRAGAYQLDNRDGRPQAGHARHRTDPRPSRSTALVVPAKRRGQQNDEDYVFVAGCDGVSVCSRSSWGPNRGRAGPLRQFASRAAKLVVDGAGSSNERVTAKEMEDDRGPSSCGAQAARRSSRSLPSRSSFLWPERGAETVVDAFPDVTNIQCRLPPKPRAVRRRKSSVSPPCRWKWQ